MADKEVPVPVFGDPAWVARSRRGRSGPPTSLRLNVGDLVEWEVSGRYSTVSHSGKVVFVIRPFETVWEALGPDWKQKVGGSRFISESTGERSHESYIVQVERTDCFGKGKLEPHFYRPVVATLRPASGKRL